MSEFNENNQDIKTDDTSVNQEQQTASESSAQKITQLFGEGPEVVSGVDVAKKGSGKIIAVIVAVVVLIFGASAACYACIPQVKNAVKMLMNSPEEYYAWVEEENIDEYSWLFDAFEDVEYIGGTSKTVANIDSQGIEKLIMDTTGGSLADIGMKFPSTMTVEAKTADVDGVLSVNESIAFDGNPLMTYNVYIKDSKLYYQIPELSSSYICFDFEQIIELILSNASVGEAADISSMLPEGVSFDEEIISEEELRELLVKYTNILLENVQNVKLEKNASCEADGVKCEYTKLKVNIDEGTLFAFAKAAVKELKNEETVIKIVEMLGLTKSEYQAAIDELSSGLEKYDLSGGNVIAVMNVYVNSKGEVVGREFTDPEESDEMFRMGYMLANDSNKYGFTLFVEDGSEKYSVDGNAAENSGKLSGEGRLNNNGENILGITFKDFETVDELCKGSFTIGLSSYGLDDMTFKFDIKDGKQICSTDFTYQGTKLFDITEEITKGKPDSITAFDESAKVYNFTADGSELEQYEAEINTEEFAKKFLNVFGMDEAYIDEFMQGFSEGFSYGIADDYDDFMPETETDLDFDTTVDDSAFDNDPYVVNTAEYDLTKVKIQIDGKDVTLPGKVDGIMNDVDFGEDSTLQPGDYGYGFSSDYTMTVTVENKTDKPLDAKECDIINISATEDSNFDVVVDDIKIGDDITKATEKYNATLEDPVSGFIDVISPDGYSYITFFYESGKIYEIDLNF